jgi:hypothetical protein
MPLINRYELIKSAVAVLLLIAGFLLHFEPAAKLSIYYFLAAASVVAVFAASTARFRQAIYETLIAGAVVGITFGYGYGVLSGILAATLACIILYFEKKRIEEFTCFLYRIDDLVISYSAAFIGSYPIYRYAGTIYFFLSFALLMYAFFEGINYLNTAVLKRNIDDGVTVSGFRINMLPLILTAGMVSIFLFKGEYLLAFFISLSYPIILRSFQRFRFPSSAEILLRAADFLERDVFSGESTLVSAESFSKALAQTSSQNISADRLFTTYLLSALYWAPMSRTLFRQPERLNYSEFEVLSENSKAIAEAVEEAFQDKELTDSVAQFYENYDGSGIPKGLENGDISVLSRAGRVLERYLMLTSWKENLEPLTDEEAVRIIKEGSGKIYDPHFVSELEEIVLPKSLEGAEGQGGEEASTLREEVQEEAQKPNQRAVEDMDNDQK